jgi:hypothetical protein
VKDGSQEVKDGSLDSDSGDQGLEIKDESLDIKGRETTLEVIVYIFQHTKSLKIHHTFGIREISDLIVNNNQNSNSMTIHTFQ